MRRTTLGLRQTANSCNSHLSVQCRRCGLCVGVSRLDVPRSSCTQNHCSTSPIYSKLLDDSMSSTYDEPPTAHCNAPPTDHIPRLREAAHAYWVLEQSRGADMAPRPHTDERGCCGAPSRPSAASASCWRPLPNTHGIYAYFAPYRQQCAAL